MKIIIYGLGRRGRQIAEILSLDNEILGFCDQNFDKNSITLNKQNCPAYANIIKGGGV